MDLKIIKCRYEDVAGQYPEIHREVFGDKDPAHFPAVVYLVFEADRDYYIGFFSGYYHDAHTLYIQRMGIPEKNHGKWPILGILGRITDHLRAEGHQFVMARVEASNRTALLLALRDRWQIHGVQADTMGKLYVQIIKTL